MIVLDTSLVGPLAIPDEQASLSFDVIATMFDTPAIVPGHWRLEVANMLRTAVRQGRLTSKARRDIFERLAALPVETDPLTWDGAWAATVVLSDRHGLTPYDAAYLELAKRRDLALATRDRALARAARAEAITVLSFDP